MSKSYDDYMERSRHRSKVEMTEEWHNWINEMPFIPMSSDWEVAPIPPFGGAMGRLRIRLKSHPHLTVSIYFDVFHTLGCGPTVDGKPLPYWELYPWYGEYDGEEYVDVNRFGKDDVQGLHRAIHESFDNQLSRENTNE